MRDAWKGPLALLGLILPRGSVSSVSSNGIRAATTAFKKHLFGQVLVFTIGFRLVLSLRGLPSSAPPERCLKSLSGQMATALGHTDQKNEIELVWLALMAVTCVDSNR